VFAGTRGRGLQRRAGTGPWEQTLDPGGTITCVGVGGDGAVFAAYDGYDGLQRSRDNGTAWTQLPVLNGTVTALAFSPDGTVYAGAVYISTSTDGGDRWYDKHWFSYRSTVQSLAVNSIDSGATWMPFNAGLGDLSVRALAVDPDGFLYAGTARGVYRSAVTTTRAEAPASAPAAFELLQNYPNPFTAATSISIALPERCSVSLTVHDALGRQVAVLADGMLEAGTHVRRWNGAALPAGVYFCRLQAGSHTDVKALSLRR
jgi:hypothetical protein